MGGDVWASPASSSTKKATPSRSSSSSRPTSPPTGRASTPFEGSGYRRVTAAVALPGETLPACIYVLAQ